MPQVVDVLDDVLSGDIVDTNDVARFGEYRRVIGVLLAMAEGITS